MDIWVGGIFSARLELICCNSNALYAVMVLSLTIGLWNPVPNVCHSYAPAGFGDFAPITPAGRVVFIVYALMAVPIVTSFAVQTITGLVSLPPRYSSYG